MYMKYFLCWFGMMVLAVINGALRDFTYKKSIGTLAAHQLSTITLLVLLALYFWIVFRLLPLPSSETAWTVGIMWFLLTLIFEFGIGKFVSHKTWSELLHAYNLFAGQVWLFIPLWVLVAPYFYFRLLNSLR